MRGFWGTPACLKPIFKSFNARADALEPVDYVRILIVTQTNYSQLPNLRAIKQLVDNFKASERTYCSPSGGYQEAEVRSEFIDPFLDAFGWDTANRAGVDAEYRPVLREETQRREDSHAKKPDYTLRLGKESLLYVEAKKPAVNILSDMESIRQARAYGYTEGHPIVILTNFRDLSVYDTSSPSRDEDLPATCRLFTCHYTEFEAKQEEIAAVIGQAQVTDPRWREQFTSTRPSQAIPADQAFVRQINIWRSGLGMNIIANHPETSPAMLNDVVQRLINRLIFVRMCEDRGIEGESILRAAAAGSATDIEELFKRLDRRYNSGLFDQSNEHTEPVPMLDAAVLTDIIDSLYSPRSPFSFAVLDADFLGLVYESSLSEQLEIIPDGDAKTVRLTPKLEYAKRDVVTTPQELVRTTVEQAWKSLEVMPPAHPKVLDFAVGSGRFLLSAFEQYLAIWTKHLIEVSSPQLIKTGPSAWKLSFEEKCRLLKENFFGIDVDYNAVEVARFSLLVRLLEDEDRSTLPSGQKILPDLDANIVHGNTLVRELPSATDEQRDLAVPLDLTQTALPEAFDLIIGNPPYMQTKEMKSFNPAEFNYLKANYQLLHQQFDKYFAFLEFALDHAKDEGVISVVIPNKWMTNVAGKKLRLKLMNETLVGDLVNYRHNQLFPGKTIYVCALTLKKSKKERFRYSEPSSILEHTLGESLQRKISYTATPSEGGAWVLPANDYEATVLSALTRAFVPLSSVVHVRNGIQTSKNRTYILTDVSVEQGEVAFQKAGTQWAIEEEVTRPYLEDSKTIRSYHSVVPDARVIYPYKETDVERNPSGFEIIPVDEMRCKYPKAYAYLAAHEAGMSNRAMNTGVGEVPFYAYGRVQAIGYAASFPKILYSVNQTGKKYGLDETGIAFSSGGTAGEAALYPTSSGYSLDFVLALLDQTPIEFYLRKRGSAFRGGYVSRGTDVIEEVPVPNLDFGNEVDRTFHDHVSAKMAELRQKSSVQPAPREQRQHDQVLSALKRELDICFARRWGLDLSDYGQLKVEN
jgi:hypothetical protein